jgi:hypothetical protein
LTDVGAGDFAKKGLDCEARFRPALDGDGERAAEATDHREATIPIELDESAK